MTKDIGLLTRVGNIWAWVFNTVILHVSISMNLHWEWSRQLPNVGLAFPSNPHPTPIFMLNRGLMEALQKEVRCYQGKFLSMSLIFFPYRYREICGVRFLKASFRGLPSCLHYLITFISLSSLYSSFCRIHKISVSLGTIFIPSSHHSPHIWCNLIMCWILSPGKDFIFTKRLLLTAICVHNKLYIHSTALIFFYPNYISQDHRIYWVERHL